MEHPKYYVINGCPYSLSVTSYAREGKSSFVCFFLSQTELGCSFPMGIAHSWQTRIGTEIPSHVSHSRCMTNNSWHITTDITTVKIKRLCVHGIQWNLRILRAQMTSLQTWGLKAWFRKTCSPNFLHIQMLQWSRRNGFFFFFKSHTEIKRFWKIWVA